MKKKPARKSPMFTVYVWRPSGFVRGVPLVRGVIATAPAPWLRRYRIGHAHALGLRVVRSLPDGAAFIEVVDNTGRSFARWKPCAVGRYTGTYDAPPHFTEWVPV